MHIAILYNQDHELLEDDPGREAREDVTRVASALAHSLSLGDTTAELIPVEGAGLGFVDRLARLQPALVVNLCESIGADNRAEPIIPSLLDVLGLPYTGSPALSLSLALHKDKAKEVLQARGVSTPAFLRVDRLEDLKGLRLSFPLIVKPAREHASVGINRDSVVKTPAELRHSVELVLRTLHQPALIEQFIPGREIYVPLLGNNPRRALPFTEICFGQLFDTRPNIVTYSAKWEASSQDYLNTLSATCHLTDAALEERILYTAQQAFSALECQDYGRVDLRVSPEGVPYVIDINPNCDLHPDAGYAKAARAAGMDYAALAQRLVALALERTHGHPIARRKGPGAPRLPDSPNRNVLAGGADVRDRVG